MNKILNLTARPDRFLKPGRSLLLLMLLVFCTTAFAAPTTPTTDFIDNGDGTVTHKLTGLVWMRCSMGQNWDKATASCSRYLHKFFSEGSLQSLDCQSRQRVCESFLFNNIA